MKLHDIPNTMAGAAAAIIQHHPWAFNVHASAGRDAIRAAVEKRGTAKVFAVTVLTSLDDDSCAGIYHSPVHEAVLRLAREAYAGGVQGFICSPQEVALLRSNPDILGCDLVTPGVRPTWAAKGNQKRVTTPGDAIRAGATYLVIGRPITAPPLEIGSPATAVRAIIEEIETALSDHERGRSP